MQKFLDHLEFSEQITNIKLSQVLQLPIFFYITVSWKMKIEHFCIVLFQNLLQNTMMVSFSIHLNQLYISHSYLFFCSLGVIHRIRWEAKAEDVESSCQHLGIRRIMTCIRKDSFYNIKNMFFDLPLHHQNEYELTNEKLRICLLFCLSFKQKE